MDTDIDRRIADDTCSDLVNVEQKQVLIRTRCENVNGFVSQAGIAE